MRKNILLLLALCATQGYAFDRVNALQELLDKSAAAEKAKKAARDDFLAAADVYTAAMNKRDALVKADKDAINDWDYEYESSERKEALKAAEDDWNAARDVLAVKRTANVKAHNAANDANDAARRALEEQAALDAVGEEPAANSIPASGAVRFL
jgi:hypothetical protein